MWFEDVITKRARAWDELIWPYCSNVEVMDLAVNKIYYISGVDFHNNKEVVNNSGERYYVVKRDLWEQELLTMYPSSD